MANLPAWALAHLEANLPAGNPVVNAQRVRRNAVLANTRLGAVLVTRGFWTGIRHVFLEVPAQKTAFRCARCEENLQFYNLEIPSDVYCSRCASRYHVDAEGKVTDDTGDPVASEFKAKEIYPFPPVRRRRATGGAPKAEAHPAARESPAAVHAEDGVPFQHKGYTLYARHSGTGTSARTLHFFAKATPRSGEPAPLPPGYTVGTNSKTGLPYLRRAGSLDKPRPQAADVASPLSPKQLAQRRYAARMKGVRKRARKAKGGKGRIASRRVATRMRRDLGLGS